MISLPEASTRNGLQNKVTAPQCIGGDEPGVVCCAVLSRCATPLTEAPPPRRHASTQTMTQGLSRPSRRRRLVCPGARLADSFHLSSGGSFSQ